MSQHITEGIVLRVTEYRESDRIVLFYTRRLGKIGAIARHAIKSRRRFGTQLTVFQLLQLKLKQKSHQHLALLEEVKPLVSLNGIYRDWRRIAAACIVADLVNEMTREGSVNPKLFDVCRCALIKINGADDWCDVLARFELELLEASGYRPTIGHCVSCHRDWHENESAYWVHSAGGLHCQRCLPHGSPFEIVHPPLLNALQDLADNRVSHALPCASLLYTFIRYQLGRPVRAWQFLEEMGLL